MKHTRDSLMADPSLLHVQVFTEHRTGMKVGHPQRVIKVTHLPTGLWALGHGERTEHKNRDIALELLAEKLNKEQS